MDGPQRDVSTHAGGNAVASAGFPRGTLICYAELLRLRFKILAWRRSDDHERRSGSVFGLVSGIAASTRNNPATPVAVSPQNAVTMPK